MMSVPKTIEITGNQTPEFNSILTPDAMAFLTKLSSEFGERREALLERRKHVQSDLERGAFPRFLAETKAVRDADWRVAPVPKDLQDRRVEITGRSIAR